MRDQTVSFLLPPPNLTGKLHLGHMWNAMLQDVLVRYHKIKRNEVKWYCGVDHAGLSLQIKVEQYLREQGIDPSTLPLSDLDIYLNKWAEEHRERIISQYQKLNLDLPPIDLWEYTMSPKSKYFLEEIISFLCFKKLIYRSKKLVSWDPVLKSVISDSETSLITQKKPLYRIKYPLVDFKDLYVEVDTTRPETISADIAVTISSGSQQYLSFPEELKDKLVKKEKIFILNPYLNKNIYLILDDKYTKPDFGTGAVKRTPSHDANDFRWWEETKDQISYSEYLTVDSLPYIFSEDYCFFDNPSIKETIISKLNSLGYLSISDPDYLSESLISNKTGVNVESILSYQIFMNTTRMISEILEDPEKLKCLEDIKFFPESNKNIIIESLKSTKDWCISRQIRWGVKLSWSVDSDGYVFPIFIKSISESGLNVESLDTWLSSGIWNLICSEEKQGIAYIVSGKDIMFPWISKMIFLYLYLVPHLKNWKLESPFKHIYLHGLILDSSKKKMSKSLDNGIDPIKLMNDHELDLIRLAFISKTVGSNNIVFSESMITEHSKFLHKLKNAYKFLKIREINFQSVELSDSISLNENETWFLSEFNRFIDRYEDLMKSLDFYYVVKETVEFVWEKFCNRYLEFYRLIESSNVISNSKDFAGLVWNKLLLLLKPLIPSFVEEVSVTDNCLLEPINSFNLSSSSFAFFFSYINIFTELRKKWGISWTEKIRVWVKTSDSYLSSIKDYFSLINQEIIFTDYDSSDGLIIHLSEIDAFFKVELLDPKHKVEYIDFIKGRVIKLSETIKVLESRACNENFIKNAEKHIVDDYLMNLDKNREQYKLYLSIIEKN